MEIIPYTNMPYMLGADDVILYMLSLKLFCVSVSQAKYRKEFVLLIDLQFDKWIIIIVIGPLNLFK